jgi:hypothetical protein
VSGDLGDFLAEGGAIVGGGAALGATLGFIVGSLVHDVRPKTDPERWTRKGGLFGGVLGLVALALRGVESMP